MSIKLRKPDFLVRWVQLGHGRRQGLRVGTTYPDLYVALTY
jgi:hypothetical protein